MIKKCQICGKEFETIQYGGARKYCFDCVPPTDSQAERTINKRNAFKKEAVRRLGGKCMKCGDTRHYVLNFHHLNPNQKEENPSRLLANSQWEDFIKETSQCILLCSNCHQEFHYLEAHNNLTIEDYVDLTNFKGQEIVVIEQIDNQRYCSECGAPITLDSKSGLCINCFHTSRRLVDRPDPITLANEIINSSFCAVGRKYGVSDNAIRKWCMTYGMPTKKNEIKEWLLKQ